MNIPVLFIWDPSLGVAIPDGQITFEFDPKRNMVPSFWSHPGSCNLPLHAPLVSAGLKDSEYSKIFHPKVLYNPTDLSHILQVKDIERALFDEYNVHPTVYCLPVKVRTSALTKMCTVDRLRRPPA